MKTSRAMPFILCGCLCLGAGWTGRMLSQRYHHPGSLPVLATDSHAARQPPSHVEGATTASLEKLDELNDRLKRQAAARCTSDALWALINDPNTSSDLVSQIARELIDREGTAAVRNVVGKGKDFHGDYEIDIFLAALAEKDPAAAMEIYRSLDSGRAFDMDRFHSVIIKDARSRSAASLIEALTEFGVYFDFSMAPYDSFPPGYDFPAIVSYLESSPKAGTVPSDFIEGWGAQDPAALLEWIHEHPLRGGEGGLEGNYEPDARILRLRALSSIASSPAPLREKALSRLADYPQAERDPYWKDIGSSSKGVVDPALLVSAARMGNSAAYLEGAVYQTTDKDTFDPSWKQVPADQREAAIATRLASWKTYDPSPTGEKARAHWLANFRKALSQ